MNGFSIKTILYSFWSLVTNEYVLWSLAVIILIFAFRYLIERYQRWKSSWLSQLIDQRLSELKRERSTKVTSISFSLSHIRNSLKLVRFWVFESIDYLIVKFRNAKKNMKGNIRGYYLPSFVSFAIVLLFVSLLFVLSHYYEDYSKIFSLSAWQHAIANILKYEYTSSLLVILTGLASLVFALVVFIAESLRDNLEPDLGRVLLRGSGLWILVVFTILSLVTFLFFRVTIFSVVFPVMVAVLLIKAFWRVIKILMEPRRKKEGLVKIIKENISRITEASIRERVGNNILFGMIGTDKTIKLDYTFSKAFVQGSVSDYVYIDSPREGRLTDINLIDLKNLVDLIEESASRLGYSSYSFVSRDSTSVGGAQDFNEANLEGRTTKRVYFLRRLGERLIPRSIFNEDGMALLALPKEFYEDRQLRDEISTRLLTIFKFTDGITTAEAFRAELAGVKDHLIISIRNHSLGSVEDSKDTYLQIAETFLEKLHKYGTHFSAQQAQQEKVNQFFGGWQELHWLRDDLREILEAAVASKNRDIFRNIAFLPMTIAVRAIQAQDHLLFQEFLVFCVWVYHYAKDESESSFRAIMVDRSWRFLKEICDIYIESKIAYHFDELDVAKLEGYKDFALYSLKIFQLLLKAAFDERDLPAFEKFIEKYSLIYTDTNLESYEFRIERLQWMATAAAKDSKQIIDDATFEELKKKVSHVRSIDLGKQQVLFGISARVFDELLKSQESEEIRRFFDQISTKLPADLNRITKVFISSRTFETEEFWGWDDWEMIPDGEVHLIDVQSKLDRFYCIKSLQILGRLNPEQISQITLTHSRHLANFADEASKGGVAFETLKLIQQNPENWPYLNELERSKVPDLIDLLSKAKTAQDEEDKQYLISAELEPEKVDAFKSEIITSFKRNGRLRPIMEKNGNYNDRTKEINTDLKSWGYNQIDEKAPLIRDWHVSYPSWGEHYGRGLAESEDEIALIEIAQGVDVSKTVKLEQVISEITSYLDKKSLNEPIILQTPHYNLEYLAINKSDLYIPSYHKDCPKNKYEDLIGYMGVLQWKDYIVPVIDIYSRKQEIRSSVFVIDLVKLGEWHQFSPITKESDAKYQEGMFLLKIENLNSNDQVRNEIVQSNVEWLRKHDNPEKHLRSKVLINLFEKFQFEIKDSSAGIVFKIPDTDALNNSNVL